MLSKPVRFHILFALSQIFASVVLAQDVTVMRDAETESVIFLKVDESALAGKSAGAPDPTEGASLFIESHKQLLGLAKPRRELIVTQEGRDELGMTHVRYSQLYRGLPVYQSSLVAHLNRDNNVYLVSSDVSPSLGLSIVPVVRKDKAERLALRAWRGEFGGGRPKMVDTKLVVFDPRRVLRDRFALPRLAWQVVAVEDRSRRERTYLIDARNQNILLNTSGERQQVGNLRQFVYDCSRATNPNTLAGCTTRSTDPYPYSTPDANYPGYVFGRRSDVTPTPTPGPSGPCPVNDPLYNGRVDTDVAYEIDMQAAHDFWYTTFNRDGANRQGGMGYWGGGAQTTRNRTQVYTYVDHVSTMCPQNAQYTDYYGDIWLCATMTHITDGIDLDVVLEPDFDIYGHEYTHAVAARDYRGSVYSGQSGAVEEGMADIFGKFTEFFGFADGWWANPDYVREWTFATYTWFPRSLMDPPSIAHVTRGPFPDYLQSPYYWCAPQDNYGVHHNATIMGKTAYLLVEGGAHNGCLINPIGLSAAQNVFYRLFNAPYLTSTMGFNGVAVSLVQSCQDLYAGTHPEYCVEVQKAVQAVELDQSDRCSGILETTPACAVMGAGTVSTARADGTPSGEFSAGEAVWVRGTGGVAGFPVTAYLLAGGTAPDRGDSIVALDGVSATGVVAPDGTFALNLYTPQTEGSFGVLISSDHYYQAWGDSLTSFSVTQAPTPPVVQAVRPDQAPVVLFAPNEHVWALATGYAEGLSAVAIVSPHKLPRLTDELIDAVEGGTRLVTVGAGGVISESVWTANRIGEFDLIIDSNSDGLYQPGTDPIAYFDVAALADGDGLCYSGETWMTTENCHSHPLDCGCPNKDCMSLYMPMDPDPRWVCYSGS